MELTQTLQSEKQKKSLSKEETKEVWIIRAARALKHPWAFLIHFTHTMDEHDPTTLYKRFPKKAMYRVITRVWFETDVLFIEKSRQIMMSWIMAALFLWDSLTKKARRGVNQSKKQEDADAILDRQRHIYEGLVPYLPFFKEAGGLPQIKMTGDKLGTTSQLSFPENKSSITSIPQGPDILRSYTFSWIFSDEINHQPKARAGYAAAMPTTGGGGKWVGGGTPNGKQFAYYMMNGINEQTGKSLGAHELDSKRIKDKRFVAPAHLDDEGQRRWIEKTIVDMPEDEFNSIPLEELIACCPGMRYWKPNGANFSCLRIHYTADPDKDPITEKGREWYNNERPKYTQPQWEREFEIRYDTFEGRPVVTNWARHIFVRNPEYDSNFPLRLSFDYGRFCGCMIAQYVPIEDFNIRQLRIIDEVILKESNTPEMAGIVLDVLKTKYLRSWQDNNILAYCDPAGNQSKETTSDKSLNTSVKIMNAHGIYPTSDKFGVPETTELIETVFALVLPNGEPAVVLHEDCEYLISVFGGGLHYPEGNVRAGYYEKDGVNDHGGDMGRYMFGNCFDQYALSIQEAPQVVATQYVRRRYTGQIRGIRKSSRINPKRGTHVARR